MKPSEAHAKLSEWYPSHAHHIQIDFWKWWDGDCEAKYMISIISGTDVMKQVHGNSIDACMAQLDPNKATDIPDDEFEDLCECGCGDKPVAGNQGCASADCAERAFIRGE